MSRTSIVLVSNIFNLHHALGAVLFNFLHALVHVETDEGHQGGGVRQRVQLLAQEEQSEDDSHHGELFHGWHEKARTEVRSLLRRFRGGIHGTLVSGHF